MSSLQVATVDFYTDSVVAPMEDFYSNIPGTIISGPLAGPNVIFPAGTFTPNATILLDRYITAAPLATPVYERISLVADGSGGLTHTLLHGTGYNLFRYREVIVPTYTI